MMRNDLTTECVPDISSRWTRLSLALACSRPSYFVGAGEGDGGGDGGGGDSGGDPGGDGGEGGGNDPSGESGVDPKEVVTKTQLKGYFEHQRGQTRQDIESAVEKSREGLDTMVSDAISKALDDRLKDPKGEKGDPDPKDNQSTEMTALQRKVDEITNELSEAKNQLKAEKKHASQKDKKITTLEALRKYGCKKPHRVYRMIKDDLERNEEGKVFTMVDGDMGGKQPLDVDEWVRTEVRVNIVPELFTATSRNGAPADGGSGTPAAGPFKFDWNKIKNDPEKLSDPKVQAAIQAGEVANLPEGVSAG